MRNLLLILSLIIFSGTTVKAQESVLFGAKAGVNFTTMESDNFLNSSPRTGFHLGLLAEVPLAKKFALQGEILYSTQGTKAEDLMMEDYKIEYNLDYIQVPLLAKIYLLEFLSVELGPSFNFLITENVNGTETEYGSGFELGGALGASFKYRSAFLSARYLYGFTDAYDEKDPDDVANNTGFQIGIGFMF